jgi:hypothetical protein
MTSQGHECDCTGDTCALPPPTEKTQLPIPGNSISTLDILRNANLTTLVNDKGDVVPIDSLPPKPLTLLYLSAVLAPTFP